MKKKLSPPPVGYRVTNNNNNNRSRIRNENYVINAKFNKSMQRSFLADNAAKKFNHNSSNTARSFMVTVHPPIPVHPRPPPQSGTEIRCYGCLNPTSDCTVPCRYPQKCFVRAPTPYSLSKCDRQVKT